MNSYHKIGSELSRGTPNYVMSRSSLLAFSRNAAAWIDGATFDETPCMVWGSLVDTVLLTPDRFGEQFAIRPGFYPSPKRGDPHLMKPWSGMAKWCKKWVADKKAQGLSVVTSDKVVEAKAAAAKIFEHPEAASIVEGSDHQVRCEWEYKDPDTEIIVPMKAMIDMAGRSDPYLAELKTAQSAAKAKFSRKGREMRYDLQCSLYSEGYRQCYEDRTAWAFVVQESDFPYPVATYYLDSGDLTTGEFGRAHRWGFLEGWRSMLARYCRCLADDKWPGYTDTIELISFTS